MALLQIAEPGQATEPHQRRIAVGIDLGTTYSLVAAVKSGSAEVLADEEGNVLLPSVVRYGPEGQVAIGAKAMEAIGRNPEAASKILVPMLLACAFAEAVAIYALVIAFSIK
jgi:molecular chaperone HscA